jgi:hypothetical protein
VDALKANVAGAVSALAALTSLAGVMRRVKLVPAIPLPVAILAAAEQRLVPADRKLRRGFIEYAVYLFENVDHCAVPW